MRNEPAKPKLLAHGRNGYKPITKRLMDSLYTPQFSPTAAFNAEYRLSSSILGGTIILGIFGALDAIVLGGNMGVVEMSVGRLSAAGSMSGILILGFLESRQGDPYARLAILSRSH
jgi:hypothetical protein